MGDGAGDTLTDGSTDLDWFFVTGADRITDLQRFPATSPRLKIDSREPMASIHWL